MTLAYARGPRRADAWLPGPIWSAASDRIDGWRAVGGSFSSSSQRFCAWPRARHRLRRELQSPEPPARADRPCPTRNGALCSASSTKVRIRSSRPEPDSPTTTSPRPRHSASRPSSTLKRPRIWSEAPPAPGRRQLWFAVFSALTAVQAGSDIISPYPPTFDDLDTLDQAMTAISTPRSTQPTRLPRANRPASPSGR